MKKIFGETSNYYKKDCLQSILLLFMSWLTGPVVKNGHIYAKVLNIVLKQTWKFFNTNFGPYRKDPKSVTSKAIFTLFSNLIALILGWNCVKGLKVTKAFKETK